MLFKFENISIKSKLILMQVFTSLLVLSIFSAGFIITDIRDYKQRKVNSMLSLAQVIATNAVSAIEFQDNEAARIMLRELEHVAPDIIHGKLLDKDGHTFASYDKAGSGNFDSIPPWQKQRFIFTDSSLVVRNEIKQHNEITGRVILVSDLKELSDIKNTKYGIAALSFIMALIFGLLVSSLVQTYISRRLLHLVNTMKEASSTNDFSKYIPDKGKDEIGTLITVYNDLMQHVKLSQQRKDEFIGIASHELKTPLTSIKGYIELLGMTEDRQPNKQFVEKAAENIVKLERLIKDLLDVSKIQSGQLQLNLGEFDMDQLINETIEYIQAGTINHQIIREGNFDHLEITADRQRIEQVLINVLSNAVKYSYEGKKVIVYSAYGEGLATIRIRDFGQGIPKEEHAKIFERFYRSKNISTNISGFGLGLYICNDIIKRHGGKIWVETEDKGSSFYITLPLSSQSNAPA